MLRISFILSLFYFGVSLDLNGGLTKKYAFMKIMSGCLGEDFVMMVKEQMMKACAECHGREVNDTQQTNLDYLMHNLKSSQQQIPISPLSQINPMYVYQPFVYPIFLQSPYSPSPIPQAPVQHQHGQQHPNMFSHQDTHIPHEYHPSFAQFQSQHPHQPNTFSYFHPSQPFQPSFKPSFQHQTLSNLPSFQPINNQPINIDINPNIPPELKNMDFNNPFNGQLRSPVPNNQLGYPDSAHHERQFFDVHHERQFYELNPQPVEAQKRKKRALQVSPQNLETLKNNLSIKIGNMTCVFREMGWLTEENDVNFTFIEQQINNLNLDTRLQEDLLYIHETCKDFSMCMPHESSKHPLMREMGGALSYMKCINTKAVTACMKHDFRMYQARMGYGDSDIGLEMVDLLGQENTNPSQLAEDIGALVFADDIKLPL